MFKKIKSFSFQLRKNKTNNSTSNFLIGWVGSSLLAGMLKIKAMDQEHTSMLQWNINLTIVHVTMKGNGMFPENITKW